MGKGLVQDREMKQTNFVKRNDQEKGKPRNCVKRVNRTGAGDTNQRLTGGGERLCCVVEMWMTCPCPRGGNATNRDTKGWGGVLGHLIWGKVRNDKSRQKKGNKLNHFK